MGHIMEREADIIRRTENEKFSILSSTDINQTSFLVILLYYLKVPCTVHQGDLILRVLDCIVTISFCAHLVLWLFLTCFVMYGCVCVCVGFVMCGCVYVWVL